MDPNPKLPIVSPSSQSPSDSDTQIIRESSPGVDEPLDNVGKGKSIWEFEFNPDDPFGLENQMNRVYKFLPKHQPPKLQILGSSSSQTPSDTRTQLMPQSPEVDDLVGKGKSKPQSPSLLLGSSSPSPDDFQDLIITNQGNDIAIYYDGLYGILGWFIESQNMDLTLNGKSVEFQFSRVFRVGELSEERVKVLRKIRDVSGGSKICYLCVPMHFAVGDRLAIQLDVINSGFSACFFAGFRFALAAGFFLQYSPSMKEDVSYFLFVQTDKSSMLASFGIYRTDCQILTHCALFNRTLPTSFLNPSPACYECVNENYLGIFEKFMDKFWKVCGVSSKRTSVVVLGGTFSSSVMLLESLRGMFPNLPIMKYNEETIVRGVLVGCIGLDKKRPYTTKPSKVLEINYVQHAWGDILCMCCGNYFSGSCLDANMFSQVDGRRLVEHENDEELDFGEDDEGLDFGEDDEGLDFGEDDEGLDEGEDDEGLEEDEDEEEPVIELDVREHQSMDICLECRKPVCTLCLKAGCPVCKNKGEGKNP